MRTRSARRAHHKRLVRIALDRPGDRSRQAAGILVQWRAEARRRARSLDAPAVWALAGSFDIQEVARHLDPTGALQADLDRVCAEAVAEVAGRHLVRGSRPLADRSRRERAR